jgi:acyl-CoA thioester hydrolase
MADLVASSGEFNDGVHRVPFRVYYEDTDTGKVVYHANYLRYMERGRTDFLRLINVNLSNLMSDFETGIVFVVRGIEIDFLSSARLDDDIIVETWMKSVSGAKLDMGQIVRTSDRILTKATVRAGITNHQGRPQRLPKDMREKMANLIIERDD